MTGTAFAMWTCRTLALAVAALPEQPAFGQAKATDWPQRQANPQHTGYTADSPKPPYRLAWTHYFPEDDEKVHPQVQPVVCRGRVFVGTKQGSLYCLGAASGKVLWKWREAKGPILNTAGCADGRVFFSCLDGFVRALDAESGKRLWAFDGGIHGFNTAPCLAEGKVFIGSRVGVFYCLDQKTGKPAWQRDLGAYIYCTAAYSDGRVYFGTEDMAFHCLDAATGKMLWRSGRLYGLSFKEQFPVVSRGKVAIRTFSGEDARHVPVHTKHIGDASAKGEFAKIPPEVSDLFLRHLRDNPHHQSLYAFEEKTGDVPFLVCHNRGGTNDGCAAPPCLDAKGNWYVALTARGAEPDWWTGMIFASIDARTGRFGRFIWTATTKRGRGANSDEQENFSVGGNILFVSQQEEGEAGHMAAFDLATAKELPIPKSMGWLVGLNYNQQQSGGHAFAIWGRRFYHIAFHCLGCWEGSER